MPQSSESDFPEHTPSRFDHVNFTRVQEGTYLDLEYTDSPLELATLIDEHYRHDDDPAKKAELLRLQRFATLASHGLSIEDQVTGARNIYAGELLALDQGYRLTGAYVHPSDEIQKTAFSLLNTIPHYDEGVGKLDHNQNILHLPRDVAFRQLERTRRWGTLLYEQASQGVINDSPDFKPLHETVDRLTETFSPERAEAIRTGFWLVMQHLILPPSQSPIIIPGEDSITAAKSDRRPGSDVGPLSPIVLNEMYPELANAPGTIHDAYYESMMDSLSVLVVKFRRARTLLKFNSADQDIAAQQERLERAMRAVLKTEVDIPIGSSLEAGGDYFFTTHENNETVNCFNQKQSHEQLRGDFDGITVKEGYTQRAYVEYRKNGYYKAPEEREPFIPYIRLKNAFMIDFENAEEPSIKTFEQPVEVAFLHSDLFFLRLTDTTDVIEP